MLCIKNGLIHDAVSATPYVGDILVENGKITQILPANSCKDAETVIDATGLNVYPGLVDAHSHLGLDGYAIGFEGQDYNEMNDILTHSFVPLTASTHRMRLYSLPWKAV